MNPKSLSGLLLAAAVLLLIAGSGAFFTVAETEQVIITQFGKPVGEPITHAGLHFKMPLIQEVHTFDKRVLEWDGPVAEMPTKDKLYIVVDTFGRWRSATPCSSSSACATSAAPSPGLTISSAAKRATPWPAMNSSR